MLKGDHVENSKQKGKEKGNEGYLNEIFNFSCVLRGHVKDLEKIKECIVENYINTGLVIMIKPTYDKKEIYIMTDDQWKEYQKLKKKDWRLIGAGFL